MEIIMECPNCHTSEIEFLGLQWFPLRVFEAWNFTPDIMDEAHPGQGAVRLYNCRHCETTFADSPSSFSFS